MIESAWIRDRWDATSLTTARSSAGTGWLWIDNKMYKSILSSKWYDLNDVLKRERNYVNKSKNTGDWKHFNYPFEQIIFSGGGIRGYSYCGGLKVKFQFGTFRNSVAVEGTENSKFSHKCCYFSLYRWWFVGVRNLLRATFKGYKKWLFRRNLVGTHVSKVTDLLVVEKVKSFYSVQHRKRYRKFACQY